MGNAEFPVPPKPVNPATQRTFRRQVRWEVYLPLALGTLALIVLVVVLARGGVGDASLWADLAVVLMAVPACVLGLVLFAALLAAGVGLARLTTLLPPYALQAQQALTRLRVGVLRAADLSVTPVVATRSAGASAQTGWRAMKRMFRPQAGGGDGGDGRTG